MYLKSVAEHSSKFIAIDTAVGVKRIDAVYKILPLQTTWTSLQSIVPTVLSLGLIGYSAINIGSVGGSRVPGDSFQRELYIRWLQLSAFMPVVEFDSPPGAETNDLDIIKLNKRLMKIRVSIVLPVLLRSLQLSRDSGQPIIRPLFMLDDKASLDIKDQFAIGDDIVVAPIVHEDRAPRDIYLPSGWWRDELSASQLRGGKWLRNYSVPLDRVAFFTRTSAPN